MKELPREERWRRAKRCREEGRMERGDAEMAAEVLWACFGKGTVPWWCFDIKCVAQNDMTFSCVIYLFLIDFNP